MVDFTTKLPLVSSAASGNNCLLQNMSGGVYPGNTSSDWEIVSILDGELILDEVDYSRKIKEDFRVKHDENKGLLGFINSSGIKMVSFLEITLPTFRYLFSSPGFRI